MNWFTITFVLTIVTTFVLIGVYIRFRITHRTTIGRESAACPLYACPLSETPLASESTQAFRVENLQDDVILQLNSAIEVGKKET